MEIRLANLRNWPQSWTNIHLSCSICFSTKMYHDLNCFSLGRYFTVRLLLSLVCSQKSEMIKRWPHSKTHSASVAQCYDTHFKNMLRQSCTWQSEELKRFVPLVWLWHFVAMDTRPGVTSCSYSTLSEAVNRRTFFSCATSDPAPVCLIAAPVPIDGQSHFPIDPLLASRARQEFDSSLID